MTITTKFNYGDTVYYMRHNRAQKGEIVEVRFLQNAQLDGVVGYDVLRPGSPPEGFTEDALFATFEELRDSLKPPTA